jgi:hypothetical protein
MRVAGAILVLGMSSICTRAQAQGEGPFPNIDRVPSSRVAREEESSGDVRYFTAKISAGGAVRHIYDNFIMGADFTVALGSNTNGHAGHYYALVNASAGRTLRGLFVWQIRLGHLHEWSIDRVRAGFAPEFGWFVIERATNGKDMIALVIGLAPHISVDIVQFCANASSPGALYAALRAGVDVPFFATPDTAMGNGTLALGVRF